jgi:hypothetical protein
MCGCETCAKTLAGFFCCVCFLLSQPLYSRRSKSEKASTCAGLAPRQSLYHSMSLGLYLLSARLYEVVA